VGLYERAVARRQALGEESEAVWARYGLAECHRELSQYGEAREEAEAGLAAAEGTGDPALVARGHITLSNALRSGQLAPVEVIRGHLVKAHDLAVEGGAAQLCGEASFWLGVVAVNSGDTGAALCYDREALACFRRTGAAGWEAITHNNLAYHGLLGGQARQALHWAEEGLALAEQIGSRNAQGWLLSTLGEVQTHLGRLEEARATLTEGLALVTRYGPRRLRPGILADLARVAIADGEWEVALAHLEEALELALETAPQFVPRLRVILAEALLGQGELARAGEEARRAQAAADEKGQRGVVGRAWRLVGQIHAAAGRTEAAEGAFGRSLAQLEGTGDGLEAARTRSAWGRWLAGKGDPRADGLLQAARAAFERTEAALDLAVLST
jgi:tetratricopeptide (TPR) repeat protein